MGIVEKLSLGLGAKLEGNSFDTKKKCETNYDYWKTQKRRRKNKRYFKIT